MVYEKYQILHIGILFATGIELFITWYQCVFHILFDTHFNIHIHGAAQDTYPL